MEVTFLHVQSNAGKRVYFQNTVENVIYLHWAKNVIIRSGVWYYTGARGGCETRHDGDPQPRFLPWKNIRNCTQKVPPTTSPSSPPPSHNRTNPSFAAGQNTTCCNNWWVQWVRQFYCEKVFKGVVTRGRAFGFQYRARADQLISCNLAIVRKPGADIMTQKGGGGGIFIHPPRPTYIVATVVVWFIMKEKWVTQ